VKPLADQKKGKKTKKIKKNFGSFLFIPKLKSVPSLAAAWRCRPLSLNCAAWKD
jgi:hypothetical protein